MNAVFAATARCRCGAGLAYDKDDPRSGGGSWTCSKVLLEQVVCLRRDDAKAQFPDAMSAIEAQHPLWGTGGWIDVSGQIHDDLSFAFFKVKSENQPSANGASTR